MIDQRIKDGQPLTVTFHGVMDENGVAPTEQRFQAMISILDYLKAKESAVRLVTHSQLVDQYFPARK